MNLGLRVGSDVGNWDDRDDGILEMEIVCVGNETGRAVASDKMNAHERVLA